MPHDAKQLAQRYKGVLALQARCALGRPMQLRDRGLLQAALALLYQQDELEAREKLRRDKEKRRKQAEQAAAESADAAAFSALFLEPQAAALSLKEAAAAAAVSSRSHSRSDASLPDSLASSPALKPSSSSSSVPPPASASIPPPLSSECSVCYSSFGSEWEGVTCVRVRASLCGHASLCAECFTTYLRSCVQEGIVMPFIRCPEPGCKLPLDHRDLASRAPSLAQAQVFESQYEHERELAIRRDERAVERKAARKAAAVAAAAAEAGLLASQPSAWPPSSSSSSAVPDAAHNHEEEDGANIAANFLLLDSGSDEETDRRAVRRGSKVASGSPRRKASRFQQQQQQQQRRKSSSSASSSSECADNAVAAPGALVASAPAVAGADAPLTPPVAPPMNAASSALPDYFLPNDLLLQLARLHLHKALHQCRDWLPCGTHPLGSGDEAATAADAKAKAEVPAAADDSSEERKSDDDDSSPSPASASAGATNAAAPSPSTAAPSATRSSSSPACPFGFVLAPAWTAAGKAKDKLKKCDHCGELQIVVNKSAHMAAVAHDPGMQAMLDAGTLRPCPQCDALNMKDYGLCNVLQCHTCQIWWNWESRATGKSAQALKDLARRTGTMWLPGELQYNTTLQRTNLPAFIDLLKRNGVEYDPNFVRGASHSKII